MKLLTISVAAYNAQKYLGACLQSLVVDKKWREFLEVIIVDDGSTDNTTAIAQKFVCQFPEIFTLLLQKNGGYATTIQKSITQAHGTYFRLCDADDFFDTPALEKELASLSSLSVDLIVTDYQCINDRDQSASERHTFAETLAGEIFSPALLSASDQNISMHALTVKTDLLRATPLILPAHTYYTDTLFTLQALARAHTCAYLPVSVYQYRTGHTEQSINRTQMVAHYQDYWQVSQMILAFAQQQSSLPTIAQTTIVHILASAYGISLYDDPDRQRATQRLATLDAFMMKNYPSWRERVFCHLPSLRLASFYHFHRQRLDKSFLWQANLWRQKRKEKRHSV